MRPLGPLPVSCARLTPSSSASLRTRGVARGRSSVAWRPFPSDAVDAPRRGASTVVAVATGAFSFFVASASGASAAGAAASLGAAASAPSSAGTGEMSAGTSPSAVSSRASSAPTGIVSPSCTRISLSVPETGHGSSTFTLSVLISTIGSYFSTLSPGFFSQRSIVPSVTVSPTSGIVSVNAIGASLCPSRRRAYESLRRSSPGWAGCTLRGCPSRGRSERPARRRA